MDNRAKITKTLLYYKIFQYPLTKQEIWDFLEYKITKKEFEKEIQKFKNYNSFYFLTNKKIISQRLQKEKYSINKLKKASKISNIISLIPSLKFIGISGSLSMKNSERNDDIDLFIISEKNLVWFSRLIIVLVLSLLGAYRNKNEKKEKDKICVNFIIGTNELNFKKQRRNIYTAHEITQLLPLFDKDNTYKKFLQSNIWIYKLLPNAKNRIETYKFFSKKSGPIDVRFNKIIKFIGIEKIAKFFQYNYMKKDITTEEIANNFLAFHPKNYETIILNKLKSE